MAKDPAIKDFLFNRHLPTPNTYNENFDIPPEKPGIYYLVVPKLFVCDGIEFQIMYIGSSKNLARRYDRHAIKRLLTAIYGYVQFYFIETEDYIDVEKLLIKLYKPKFNIQYK